jgi:hypothetical protein
VKHLKNSQEINYATDTKICCTEIQLISPSILLVSQMLSVSTFGYTADIYAIIHFIPHVCQHITVDQSHSSSDTADLTPYDFFLWGGYEGHRHSATTNLQDRRNRITATVALVYRDMLTHVWDEMEYRYLPYNQSWTN